MATDAEPSRSRSKRAIDIDIDEQDIDKGEQDGREVKRVNKSDFFVAACSNDQEKTVRLDNLGASTFFRYLDWANTDRIDLHITDLDAERAGGPPEPGRARAFTRDTAMQLCQLYVAADLLLDSQLKINIIDDLTALPEFASTMSVHCVQYVWQHTASGCGLQNFFLDCAAAYHSKKFIMHCKHTGIFSSDFMSDLTVRLFECRSMKKARYSPVYSRRCVYHDHNDDERGRCTAAQQDA